MEAGAASADTVVARVLERGRAWLSSVTLEPGRSKVLRACVCNHRTTAEDVAALLDELRAVLAELGAL
jgi:hypothetical protein